MKRTAGVILGLAGLIFLGGHPTTAFACGNVITIAYDDNDLAYDNLTPIEDCTNPFNADSPDPFTYSVTLAEQPVSPNATIEVMGGQNVSGTFTINKSNGPNTKTIDIYKQEGSDYRLIESLVQTSYSLPPLAEGGYVAVLTYAEISFQSNAEPLWQQWLKNFFLPVTAYAYYPDYQEVVTVPFSITHKPTTPTGASSVLFLPGIMGSRLYEAADACSKSGEQELWFSADDCMQLRLRTSFIGQSDNDIYTKDTDESVIEETLSFNLYKSFINEFKALEANRTIAAFEPFPYDWRLQLDDIIKSTVVDDRVTGGQSVAYSEGHLYQTVSELADNSLSGKVTIVTHSNGGLVAKAFLSILEANNDPLLSKIDNLILVGVPQSGTPESVISLLHGSEIGPFGSVLNQETSRNLINSMPFTHHLLPSETYFSNAADPTIIFEPGAATDAWRSQFGESITDKDALHSFLSKDSGRADPDASDLATPEVSDPFLLDYATVAHQIQSNWSPPSTLNVSQIAGVGIQTPATITYFTDQKCVARNPLLLFACTQYEPKLGMRITTVPEGDGTVIGSSAKSMQNVETWWLDLEKYDKFNFQRVHKDMFEVQDIQTYISNIIGVTNVQDYEYISKNSINLTNKEKVVYQLHSPLDMEVISPVGVLSSTTRTIEGGYYQRFGELQYISVPKDVPDTKLLLSGQAFGSFTLEIESWEGNELLERVDFVAIPTDVGTRVTLIPGETLASSTLALDYEGDGVADAKIFTDNEVVSLSNTDTLLPPPATGENTTSRGGGGTKVRLSGQVAGAATLTDPYWQEIYRLLTELARLLDLLNKNKV